MTTRTFPSRRTADQCGGLRQGAAVSRAERRLASNPSAIATRMKSRVLRSVVCVALLDNDRGDQIRTPQTATRAQEDGGTLARCRLAGSYSAESIGYVEIREQRLQRCAGTQAAGERVRCCVGGRSGLGAMRHRDGTRGLNIRRSRGPTRGPADFPSDGPPPGTKTPPLRAALSA